MKKLFFLIFGGVSLILIPATTQAYDEPTYYGLDETAAQAGLQQPVEAPTVIGNVIGNALSLIGVIFFVLMVYGGFLWMTAHGDSGQVDKARETIMAAIIGMIVVLGSYSLTQFILSAPTGGPSGSSSNSNQEALNFGGESCTVDSDCSDGMVCSSDGICAIGNNNQQAAVAPEAPQQRLCHVQADERECATVSGCSWIHFFENGRDAGSHCVKQSCIDQGWACDERCRGDMDCSDACQTTEDSCLSSN